MRPAVPAGRPMHVMFVVPDLYIGGAERHLVTLLPRLDPQRFTGSVVCIGAEGEYFAKVREAGFPARALGRGRRGWPAALVELVREMRRRRPDVVVLRGLNAELLGRVAAVLARVPHAVVWFHNCGGHGAPKRLQRLADRFLDRITTSYYGVAHGQVPYLTGQRGLPAAKVRIIQNGIDPDGHRHVPEPVRGTPLAAELGVADDDLVVGIVAVVRPEKDHATFLRAARLVLAREPRARFLVVGYGDGDDLENVQRLAAELGIADRVVFTGSRDDVPDLLAVMDVFVLCSYTVECFPMALLEAMAVGRPAVCTAVGGIPEMIDEGRTGHVVAPRDPAALADGLLRVLADPARARAMGLAARRRVETEFTLARSVRRTEEQLDETAGRTPAPAP